MLGIHMKQDPIEILKTKTIVDFISTYTPIHIEKTGKNYSCPCPFHGEKEASFYIDPDKNRWTCYGSCGTNGDLIDFVKGYKHLDFNDALEYLCDVYQLEHIKKKPIDTNAVAIKKINNFVADYYSKYLNDVHVGHFAREYLNERKQSIDVLREFNVGYAPAPAECGWDLLYREICKQNLSIALSEKIGLIKKSKLGSYIDSFHGRIIFPIYNLQGDVIGFNTRLIPCFDDKKYKLPRYLLSLETEVFSRKQICYGYNKTKIEIEKKNICIFVEGIFDFYRLYQSGIKNCIPLLGGQFNDVKNINTYYLMMDFDKAGIKYSGTIGSKLISENKVVRICKNKKDPDDLTRPEIIKSIRESEDFIDWYISSIFKYEDSIEHKLNVLEEVSRLLITNKKENVILYSDKISKRLNLPLGVVVAHISSISPNYKDIFTEFNKV